jgi:DNA-binding CsgD family transcriptional regulator
MALVPAAARLKPTACAAPGRAGHGDPLVIPEREAAHSVATPAMAARITSTVWNLRISWERAALATHFHKLQTTHRKETARVQHGRKSVKIAPSPLKVRASCMEATGEVQSAEKLTRREQEVLVLIADGCTNKEIAARLGISFKTVACHRYRIMEKLNARNAVQVVRYAIRKSLIQP